MITGDYPATARAIGAQAGLDATKVLSGDEIDALTDESLALVFGTRPSLRASGPIRSCASCSA
jgi:magnesium-transporting ATPase (P-type)